VIGQQVMAEIASKVNCFGFSRSVRG